MLVQVELPHDGRPAPRFQSQENRIHKELFPLIVEGLKSSPRFFPSLLLWDAKGVQLYERIMCPKDYYLTQTEAELIRLNVDSIVDQIRPNSVILELGSGYFPYRLVSLLKHLPN